ncbi:beta-class carbonic anhydrase [Angustibacter aerolatus]
MTVIDDVVERNRRYAETFDSRGLGAPPVRQLAVVTCMDARIDVLAALGLDLGDANVLRNAGGVVTERELHDLVVSQRKLGTREIMVVLHTRCGMRTFTDDELRDEVAAETGARPEWTAFRFGQVEDDVRKCVTAVREYEPLPHRESIRGFVYDVDTGLLTEVE